MYMIQEPSPCQVRHRLATFAKHKIKRADRFLGNGRMDLAVVSQALLSGATVSGSRLLFALD